MHRPVRPRAPKGGLRRLRRRSAAAGDTVQRRARAGEPRDRARHERQHGRREDRAAQSALDRFLYDLLDQQDEIFLYRFSDRPVLVAGMDDGSPASRVAPSVASRPTAARRCTTPSPRRSVWRPRGQQSKEGARLDSRTATTRAVERAFGDVKQLIRESEVLVYAIGIDCSVESNRRLPQRPQLQRRGPMPIPWPFPPGGRRGWPTPPQPFPPTPPGRPATRGCSDPVDAGALRDMTDDSGGRTEILRDAEGSRRRDGRHRRRTQQAVLPRVSLRRKERRPLAFHSCGAAQPKLPSSCPSRICRLLVARPSRTSEIHTRVGRTRATVIGAMTVESEAHIPSREHRTFRRFFSNLGPGLITGAADDDPSGISTYSVAGAAFGYLPLWTALFSFPLMTAVQLMCARLGTGHGPGPRRRDPQTLPAMGALGRLRAA